MNESVANNASRLGDDQTLGDLLEGIVEGIQSGQPIDIEQWIREHPEHEERLRRLLPTIQTLTQLTEAGVSPLNLNSDPVDGRSRAPMLGEFHILREIGRGGMGVVYEAEQESLSRRVALKVLPFAAVLDPRQLARFKNEAKAAATLHHPNIVPIYSVGCDRGVHFFAMQLIDGCSLAFLLDQLRCVGKSLDPGQVSGSHHQSCSRKRAGVVVEVDSNDAV